MKLFITASFIIVKKWKPPKCPSTGKWKHKPGCQGILLNNEKKRTTDTSNHIAESQNMLKEKSQKQSLNI